MSSDYWVTNPFGTNPNSLGTFYNDNGTIYAITHWAYDSEERKIIICHINTDQATHTRFCKITVTGEYDNNSSRYKNGGTIPTFNNETEIINYYADETSDDQVNSHAFTKSLNFDSLFSFNTFGGNWNYTNCDSLDNTFTYCRRLGLGTGNGTGASFRMNGCNLVNLRKVHSGSGGLYRTFYDCFGHGITSEVPSDGDSDDEYLATDVNSENVELKNWTISSATGSTEGISMEDMFYQAKRFNGDVSGWTIRSPISLHEAFRECHYFRGKGLSTWNVDAKQPIGIFNHLTNSDWETFPDGATPTITIDDMKGYGGSNNLGIVSIASTALATHGAVKQWALDTELNDNTIIITETDYYNNRSFWVDDELLTTPPGHTIFMKITLDGVKVENSGKKREGWNGSFGTAADLLLYYHDGATTSVSSLTYTFAPGPNFDNMDFTDTNAFNHYTVNNIAYSVSSSSPPIAPSTYDALDYPSYITQSVKQNVDRISATIDVDKNAVSEVFFVILASSSVFEAPSGTWASTSGGADENAEYYGVYVNPEAKWWGFEKVFGSNAVTMPNLLRNLGDEWDRQITVEYENGVITLKLGQEQVSVYTWKPVHTGKWYGVVGAGCDVTFKNVSLESKTGSQPFGMDSMFYNCGHLGDKQNIDISDSTNGAYIMLYRDGGYIDMLSMIAYDKYDNVIAATQWSPLGDDGTFPMSNAVATPQTELDVWNNQYFWSTNGQLVYDGADSYSGGWIKYPEMPYRIEMIMRYSTSRHPSYLKTSYSARLPIGTDFLEWDTKYEFDGSPNTTTYDIFLGGGNWNYTNCYNLEYAFYQCRRLGRPIDEPIIISISNSLPAPYGGESGPNGELAANGARGDTVYLARGKTYLLDFRSSLDGNDELVDLYNQTDQSFVPAGGGGRDIKLTTDNHSQNNHTPGHENEFGNYTIYTGSEVQYDEPNDDQIIITITDTTPNTLYIYIDNMANQNFTRTTITIVDEVESIGVFKMDGCNLINLYPSSASGVTYGALYGSFLNAFGYNITTVSTANTYAFDSYPIASDSSKVSFQNWTVRMYSRDYGLYQNAQFYNCKRLNANFRGWILYDPQTLVNMFRECEKFEGIGLSTWTFYPSDTPINHTLDMSSMFQGCENFDEDISDWPAKTMTNSTPETNYLPNTNYDNYGNGCDEMPDLFKNSDITYFFS